MMVVSCPVRAASRSCRFRGLGSRGCAIVVVGCSGVESLRERTRSTVVL